MSRRETGDEKREQIAVVVVFRRSHASLAKKKKNIRIKTVSPRTHLQVPEMRARPVRDGPKLQRDELSVRIHFDQEEEEEEEGDKSFLLRRRRRLLRCFFLPCSTGALFCVFKFTFFRFYFTRPLILYRARRALPTPASSSPHQLPFEPVVVELLLVLLFFFFFFFFERLVVAVAVVAVVEKASVFFLLFFAFAVVVIVHVVIDIIL